MGDCAHPTVLPVELGFETIGNATVVVHDGEPVLATDPWVRGSAYFGSWGLSYEVPTAQDVAIRAAGAVWFSHGHPDHLNPASLPLFRDARILLPDHVGGRIARELTRDGYRVEVLADRTWVRISDRVRVLCIADEGQDAVLLIDVGGRLVVNLNDAQDRGWGHLVKRVIRAFPQSFLLRLSGYGDADMINFVDEDGARIPSLAQVRKESGFEVGADVARMTETFGANHFVPFSSFHRYQRDDSAWANEWTTPVAEYARGFRSDRVTLLPAFVRYDCTTDSWEAIDPEPVPDVTFPPEEFGDDWSDTLDRDDVECVDPLLRLDRAAGALARPGHVPGGRRRAHRRARRSRHRALDHVRGAARVVAARRRMGDLRRPADRELHADHAPRELAQLGALSRLHPVRDQVRRQRSGAHRRRAPGVLRRVPPPDGRGHVAAGGARAAGEGRRAGAVWRPIRPRTAPPSACTRE